MPEIGRVRGVFQKIPSVYDGMNTLMSAGMDVFWRLELIKLIPQNGRLLDVGTGTGKLESLCSRCKDIVGIDITREMMTLNRNKGKLFVASATDIPFKEGTFDGIVSSFVLRNLPSTEKYFREGFRVLKRNGVMANLDAFPEERKYVSPFFNIYFYKIAPRIGNAISSSDSYDYLAASVRNFKSPSVIAGEMVDAGFTDVKIRKFVSPSAAIVYGKKG